MIQANMDAHGGALLHLVAAAESLGVSTRIRDWPLQQQREFCAFTEWSVDDLRRAYVLAMKLRGKECSDDNVARFIRTVQDIRRSIAPSA